MMPNFDGEVGQCALCGPCEVDVDDRHLHGIGDWPTLKIAGGFFSFFFFDATKMK